MSRTPPLLQHLSQSPLLVQAGAEELFQACVQHVVSSEHAEAMLAETTQMSNGDDFWPEANDWRASLRPYNVKNGVLQIPIMGVLLNRFGYQFGRWATGYTYIEKAFERGMADGNVRAIAFIHDSPGGEVAGNFELVDKIFQARGQKPMRSFAADHAYSASYSLASAPGPISVTRSGGVGSIGVVTAHVEYSQAMEKAGIKVTFIHAGAHKVDGNPYEALPKAVKERIQQRIDKIYGVFTSAVARNRSMDEAAVRATQALTYDAEDAISVGLADRIGALEDEMEIFSSELDAPDGDEEMANDANTKTFTQAQLDEAVTSATASATTAAKAEGFKEGTAAAVTRINGIMGCEAAKDRPVAALAAALDTEMTVEQANTFLGKLAVEKKADEPAATTTNGKPAATRNHFQEAMGGNNPEVGEGAGTEDDDGGAGTAASATNSILGDFAKATGMQKPKAA